MEFSKRALFCGGLAGLLTILGCIPQSHSDRTKAILSHRNLGLAHLEENHLEAARAEPAYTPLVAAPSEARKRVIEELGATLDGVDRRGHANDSRKHIIVHHIWE